MSTLLCVSCGHSFPQDMLEPATFSDRLGRCIGRASKLLRDTHGKSIEDDHRLVQAREVLQQLCGMVQEEVRLLQSRPKDARGSGAGAGDRAGGAQPGKKTDGRGTLPLINGAAAGAAAAAGGTRPQSQGMDGTYGGTTTSRQLMMTSMNERNAAPPKVFDNAVSTYQLKRMTSAFDLVSATLYNMLEGLAVQCRASVALLWVRPRMSSELVAPFVVGRDLAALASSAPYSTPESSVPCMVCQTGVALNLQPLPPAQDTMRKALASDLTLPELMEQTNAAQLLVPVHDRYVERNAAATGLGATATATAAASMRGGRASVSPGAAGTSSLTYVLGVVHLIGSPQHPVPFHRYNEEAAAQTAALLSFVLSSYYDTMISEWANRFYVPATLHATGKYAAGLDLRPEDKVVDDFAVPPLLMYRCAVSGSTAPKTVNEARDAIKLLQSSAVRKATPLRPMANVMDLCQHATNMEANWVYAVQQTARLEKEVDTLEEHLLRRDVAALQQHKTKEGGNSGGGNGEAGRRSRAVSTNPARASMSPTSKLKSVPPPPAPAAKSIGMRASTTTAPMASPPPPPLPPPPASTDRGEMLQHADIDVRLTPAAPYMADGLAANGGYESPPPPLGSDVLNHDEMNLLEAVSLRRLRMLGVDTALFEKFA